MQQRIFHGNLTPQQVAQALVAEFNRGNLQAQQVGRGEQIIVQIGSSRRASSGGNTALTVTLQQVADGVSVQMGQQSWFGIAASLGKTALSAFYNPISLLGRLDDLAQDLEYIQLSERVWQTISNLARAVGASHELSARLRRVKCAYCDVANDPGEARCIACGAPLGNAQPRTCLQCGFVVISEESACPNCGARLPTL